MTHAKRRDQKQLVAQSYEDQAAVYSSRRTMQTGNFTRIDELVRDHGLLPRSNSTVLDLGSGAGDATTLMRREWLDRDAGTVIGVDLSRKLTEIAKQAHGSCTFMVSDAEAIPLRTGSVDLVVANSVLHWLNAPEFGQSPAGALREVARVVARGGGFCASIAGVGTANRFRRAFHHVVEAHRAARTLDESAFRPDPIGCMELHEVVDHVLAAGLHVLHATLEYEPVTYQRAADYAADVAAYGYGVFTAAFREDLRAAAFEAMKAQFEADVGAGAYLHDQYMVYVLASRP